MNKVLIPKVKIQNFLINDQLIFSLDHINNISNIKSKITEFFQFSVLNK